MRRARPGERLAQVIALWQSGELERAARATKTTADMASRLGMTADALNNALAQARENGYPIPHHAELRGGGAPCDEWDDEPTQERRRPDMPDLRSPNIGMHTSTVQWPPPSDPAGRDVPPGTHTVNTNTERWPHVEAFDAVGAESVPLPPLGAGVARSTYVDADGNVRGQWIKHKGGIDPQQMIEAVRRALVDVPRYEPRPVPAYDDDDLLSVIAIGDAHFGMLAWGRETGESFDLEIAERTLVAAIDHLVALSPPSRRALLINVGDFTHVDSQANTTTRGTRVDVDGRWTKIIETAVRAKRRCIDSMLAKHEHVTDWNVRGNHDEASAMVLAIALAQFYEREPRVQVDVNPSMFSWYRFGANLIGATHGDKAKARDLVGVMANDRRRDWGETRHRRIYCGHYHHQIVHEIHGVVIEYVPTLAGLDAWHHGMGYRAGREIRLDVIHREHGLIERRIVGIDQLEAA